MNQAKRETTGVKLEVNQRSGEFLIVLISSEFLILNFSPAAFIVVFQHSILGSCSDLMKVRSLSMFRSFSGSS